MLRAAWGQSMDLPAERCQNFLSCQRKSGKAHERHQGTQIQLYFVMLRQIPATAKVQSSQGKFVYLVQKVV